MTTKSELKAKPQEMSFRLKGVELKPTPEGEDAYKVIVLAPFTMRDGKVGFSQFPMDMFIHGSDMVSAKEMYDWLAKQPRDSTLKLKVAPGKLRPPYTSKKTGQTVTPQDDGQFGSYYWNLVGIPAAAATQPPLAAPAASKDESSIFPPEEGQEATEPPAKRQPQPQGYWDDKDRIIGASWAITQAQIVLLTMAPPRTGIGDENEEKDMRRFLAAVVNLARRYLAIRDIVASQGPAKKE